MDLITKDLLVKAFLLKEIIATVILVVAAHLPLTPLLVPYRQSVVSAV